MSSIPSSQHNSQAPPSPGEIEQRLAALNEAYEHYRSLCGPGERFDDAQQAFYACKQWFEVRKIGLLHIQPRDPWTVA